MTDIGELPPLREVIARHGLSARKGLGQHFLFDANLTRKIARAAGDLTGSCVVEVGPGPGGLTRALLNTPCRRVVAIERDPRCVAALADLVARAPDRLTVIEGDALEIDPVALCDRPRCIVANLPYNVSTPLLTKWLAQATEYDSMTLMFQREVGLRLVARPGSRDYGRLSVAVQWRCNVTPLFDIPAEAFVPPPKVTSTVIRLTPRPAPLCEADPDDLSKVVAAAFGQRRKMLRASLRSLCHDSIELLAAAGIDPTRRAETLTIEDYCALARAFAERVRSPPASS
jgi:16S rRNA (adenine1518-N6/adenine1519-N6)-dimethyltransferase